MSSDWLPFDEPPRESVDAGAVVGDLPDAAARARAVDPSHNVVLEASAGTGKTHVLVDRYLNILSYGVGPANILAITFTRKAAAEMRSRILAELRRRADTPGAMQPVWRDVRERSGEIAISTIDAFCLSLLREFPLEAGLDPGFAMADETQVPRLMDEALDRALAIGRKLSQSDEYVRLLLAELREPRLREGLAVMIDRRLVVQDALARALASGPRDLTAEQACAETFARLRGVFFGLTGGVEGFLANGPVQQRRWAMFSSDMRQIAGGDVPPPGLARGILDRVEHHFLNKDKQPRQRFDGYAARDCRSAEAWKIHRHDVLGVGGEVANVMKGFRRDLNAVLSRGVQRVYQIALQQYRDTLDRHGVLDFSETLHYALGLLSQMEEFSRSRYRLEGRYHHVLLDEFQDTSRAQWTLVAHLIRSWGEGSGLANDAPLAPSIFVVGDRKQSIYGFRDADVAVLDDAGSFVDELRPDRDARRAISKSFRAVPGLLAFVNDVFAEIEKDGARRDAFRFGQEDVFPLEHSDGAAEVESSTPALGVVAATSASRCAEAVAAEIRRLLDSRETVRDPTTRERRPMSARDVGILFRTKDSHRDFEKALASVGVPSYVYKGLGFFEADEIKDVLALLRYLASPDSDLRAAAFLRSRFVRVSDLALQSLAPRLARALTAADAADRESLGAEDQLVLAHTRRAITRWLSLADRLPPADLLEMILDETAYAFETRGVRVRQARENLKKMRGMIRRLQNRGYATLSRVADHLDRLTAGDESNAVIDAGDSVSLMTIHAAKGLEFPVVFVVNLSKGTGGRRPAVRVVSEGDEGETWLSVGDFQSEADADAKAKDREETKRLLYVALTRARDRLYLASEVKDGKWRAFGGSLGDVMPTALKGAFEAASLAAESGNVAWVAASGQTHAFRVCPVPAAVLDQSAELQTMRRDGADAASDRLEPLIDTAAVPRRAITAQLEPVTRVPARRAEAAGSERSLAGTLVHRLFERAGRRLAESPDRAALTSALSRLLTSDERAEVDDLPALLSDAAGAYLALSAQPDLSSELEAGDALFEVPFSVRPTASQEILRGTFDCVVRRRDGGVTVLELKTGRPVPQHAEQLSMYLTAARALFPEARVDGKLVYAHLDRRPLDSERGAARN